MALVKIATETLQEIREVLTKTAAFEKRAAELEQENDIYRRTLSLVAQGLVDPAVAIEKVAEYQTDHRRFEIFEASLATGVGGVTKLGTAVDDDSGFSTSESPENKFVHRLRDVTEGLGLI